MKKSISRDCVELLESYDKGLTSSEKMYKTIFDSVDTGFCIIEMLIDPEKPLDYRFLEVNQSFERHSGLTNIRGKWMRELQPEQEEYWYEIYRDVALSRKPVRFEQKSHNRNTRWYDVYAFPVGEPEQLRLAVMFSDVTDKKNTQDSLLKSQAMLAAAFNHSPYALALSRIEDGTIIQVNDAFLDLFGMEAGAILGKTSLSLNMYADPADRDKLLKVLRKEGRVRNYELNIRTAGGEKTVSLSVELLNTDGNNNMLTTIQDISVQKRIANELVRSELRFRSTFENAAVGMAHVDREGKWIQVNNKLCSITGYSAEELKNLTFADITHPDDKTIGVNEFQSIWKSGKSLHNLEKRYIRKDGEVIWVRITVVAQLDTDGSVLYLIPVIEDITEQKKIARQIEIANRELKITHDFMESILHIAMHDLRSPVANLHLCMQCMEIQITEEAKDKYFGFFKEIVEKLINTLTDLTGILEFLSTKKVNATLVNITDLVESVKRENDHSLGNGLIHNDLKVREIKYIKPFFESLIRNTVSNAVKYRSSDRTLNVEITTRKQGEHVVFCVKDNGIGIDLEKHGSSMFQPFKRFTDKATGTGIGLYLIKNIVERNGGYVKLNSKLNVGTTVCCFLKEFEE